MQVHLPPRLRAQILAESQSPLECCGLLQGRREGEAFEVTQIHPVANLAASAARFAIDPAAQFAAQKAARAQGQAIIGCYHSHPGGAAQPSAADLAGAGEEDFLWLIASGETLNAFVYSRGVFGRLDWGADWVTSSA